MDLRYLTPALALIGLSVLTLAGCAGNESGIQGGGGQANLTVVATSPASGGPPAAVPKRITATFSSTMNADTLTTASFRASSAAGPLPGTVTCVGRTATLFLTSALLTDTEVTATLTTTAKDISGRSLVANYVWTFTTGATADTMAPVVSSTDPSNNEAGVALNKSIVAVFSEPMLASSLSTSTFKLQSQAGSVAGKVSLQNEIVTFEPTSKLVPSTIYTATLTTGVRDLSDNRLAADKVWTFTTGSVDDVTPPIVETTDPVHGAVNVPTNKSIRATFSEAMTASSINANSFTVMPQGGVPLAGTTSYSNRIAVFNPTAQLNPGVIYVANISTDVKDSAGNYLAATKSWKFTTSASGDTTSPTVLSTVPVNNATNVPLGTTIMATFSESLMANTVNTSTFKLSGPNGPVLGSVSLQNEEASFSPSKKLDADASFTATITTGVKDKAGNALAATKTWSFRTASAGDVIPPTVLTTKPANNATNVFRNTSITATFSEPMLANTINGATFTIAGVAGTVSYNAANRVATFNPSTDLASNMLYTARIETGAKDLAGNGLAVPKVWRFTTGVQRSQTSINLGSAGAYAILAGSTVTNGGPTVVNGNLGVSPGTAVTGFPPGIVNGAIHAGGATAANAKADLLAAQLDAAGRLGGATLPGDLSGLTFTPGLYKNSTSVMLSAGNVTLDAQGDVNAVFIFQMGSTLTTSPGTKVILAGGAKASNIYWSVGSSATLGVSTIFKGIILSEVSITVNTGAVVDGTLLTKIGAVTLLNNKINK